MLFVHDHTFVKNEGKYYTTGSLNNKVMSRYVDWFGSVSVFATTRNASDKDSVYIKKGNLIDNVKFNLVQKKNSIVHIVKNSSKLKDAVKEADSVVIRMSIYGLLAIIYARKYSKPYLVEMVACPWDSLWYHSKKGKILAPIMTILTKIVVRNSTNVLYVTNEFLQRRYQSRGNTIGCSDVELVKVNENQLRKRLSKIHNMEKDMTLKLCTVANIGVKYKGQELVIKAISKLKEQGLFFEYYLIGGGEGDYLKNIATKYGVEEYVHFVGAVPHEDVFDYLDQIDIYIQPSLQEGLPRAVIEAMSRACPVIGSTTGGIPELIDDDCVFKKGNYLALMKILENFSSEKMVVTAKNNFNKAKMYEKEFLDNKRSTFYKEFANEKKIRSQGEVL